MIGILNYNAGNIKSVERALDFLKTKYILSDNPKDFTKCDKLIFPGVGDATYAMKQLELTGLDSFIKDWALAKKPLLGICLGSQIIFDYSEEGDTKCLGLIPGQIKKFENVLKDNPDNLKIPHMGWNNISYINGGCQLFNSIPKDSNFYFVHSYVIQPDDFSVVKGIANYGIDVPSCIQKENIYAFQFHPEKSGMYGLKLLQNYCSGKIDSNGELSC